MNESEILAENENWRVLLADPESISVHAVNQLLKPAVDARLRGNMEPARLLTAHAKRLGYVFSKDDGVYTAPVEMKLTKGRVVIRVGWSQGVLHVEYASGPKIYTFPNVPQEDYFKLLRSIYPDSLFNKLKAKWLKENHGNS